MAALIFDVDRSSLRPAARPRPPRGETYAAATRWDFHVFSGVERRAWMAHGVTDPDQAFQCVDAGLRPRDLATVVAGVSVLSWLRSGESVGQVVARLRVRGLWRRDA